MQAGDVVRVVDATCNTMNGQSPEYVKYLGKIFKVNATNEKRGLIYLEGPIVAFYKKRLKLVQQGERS